MDLQELKQVSRNRIRKILRDRRTGNIRQLESKISEAGPPNMRPEPDLLTKALKSLKREGIIEAVGVNSGSGDDSVFYCAEDFNFNLQSDTERFNKITKLYREYLKIVKKKENCGYVLELIMQKAIKASSLYHFIGGPGVSTNKFQVNGTTIKGDFDFILQSDIGLIGVELKNKRKWLYPDHKDLWIAIYRCLINDVLPVIIARKFPYIARLVFKNTGILGYETHNQYFKPGLEEKMAEMRDKDGLGFADIRFTNEPEERHINFFRKILPSQEEGSWDNFKSKKEILRKYAGLLKEDSVQGGRTRVFYQFLIEIGLAQEQEEENYPDDDFYNFND